MSIVINGSGTITGVSAGGLPSASVTQTNLATNVAGTGPAFFAYPSSATPLSSSTWTKLVFDVEVFDTNNNFSSRIKFSFKKYPNIFKFDSLNMSLYVTSISYISV